MKNEITRRLAVLVSIGLVAATVALGLAVPATASRAPKVKITLPASIKKSGVLTVGSWLLYPPFDYELNGQPAGMDIKLLNAIGRVLHVKIKYTNIQWAAVISSMSTGRFDLVSDEMADTAARRSSGVDFVDYYKINDQVEVKAGNPDHINVNDLCGTTFTTNSGSWEQTLLTNMSSACVSSGKQPITVTYLSDYASENEAIQTGRVEATINNSASAAYEAKSSGGQLEVLPEIVPGSTAGTAGFVFEKGNRALEIPFMQAINYLESTGKWQQILAGNGARADMVKPVELNGKPYKG